MLTPIEYRIINEKSAKDMRQISFHGFKKKDLFKFLQNQIKNQNLENANYWCAECVISGYPAELFEKIVEAYLNEINIKNPELLLFFWSHFERYIEAINSYENILDVRNDAELRNILSTLVSISCTCPQFSLPKLMKITSVDLLEMPRIRTAYAHNLECIAPLVKTGDPREVVIPLNEILNHLRTPKNNSQDLVIYWLSWLVAWEVEYIKKNDIGACAERPNDKIEKLYWKDFAWLLWDVLKMEAARLNHARLKEIIDKSNRFYVYYYNKKNRYKKINFIIYCFLFFLKEIDFINFYGSMSDYAKVVLACANVNSLYKHMEKNC
jgi:hypothetical protein